MLSAGWFIGLPVVGIVAVSRSSAHVIPRQENTTWLFVKVRVRRESRLSCIVQARVDQVAASVSNSISCGLVEECIALYAFFGLG